MDVGNPKLKTARCYLKTNVNVKLLPLGGDSELGSESDDETRLRELGAAILLHGTGKV